MPHQAGQAAWPPPHPIAAALIDFQLVKARGQQRGSGLTLLCTGYMIVSMLMRQGMFLRAALDTFTQHRPAGIYKDEYIRALYDYYHEPL